MAITFVGAASGLIDTVTAPAHQNGDLLVAVAFRDGSNGLPGLPDGTWTDIEAPPDGAAASTGGRIAYKFSTGSVGSTTWSSATSVVLAVYRGVGSIGASAMATDTTSSVTYPSIALASSASWVILGASHRSGDTALETPPSGFANRIVSSDAVDETVLHDRTGASSFAGASVAVSGTPNGWRAYAVELVPAVTAIQKVKLGAADPTFRVGTTTVTRLYLGSTLVWGS